MEKIHMASSVQSSYSVVSNSNYSMDPTDPLHPVDYMLSRLGKFLQEGNIVSRILEEFVRQEREEKKDYPEDIEKLSLGKKDNSSA